MRREDEINELASILEEALIDMHNVINVIGEQVSEANDLELVKKLSLALFSLEHNFMEMNDVLRMLLMTLKQENDSLEKKLLDIKKKGENTPNEKKLEFNIFHDDYEEQLKKALKAPSMKAGHPSFNPHYDLDEEEARAAAIFEAMMKDIFEIDKDDDDDDIVGGGFWVYA